MAEPPRRNTPTFGDGLVASLFVCVPAGVAGGTAVLLLPGLWQGEPEWSAVLPLRLVQLALACLLALPFGLFLAAPVAVPGVVAAYLVLRRVARRRRPVPWLRAGVGAVLALLEYAVLAAVLWLLNREPDAWLGLAGLCVALAGGVSSTLSLRPRWLGWADPGPRPSVGTG